ncbi:MAG: hypothetical protein A2001_00510 [Treponema sp. GWC1_61_84]|nr:MAG: hypothetical protein A2001_00510 [Treponema sp. GWC1_61_84]
MKAIVTERTAHSFSDLVDLPAYARILENLYRATGIPNAILDPDGDILCRSGWIDACTVFHRTHPEASEACRVINRSLSLGPDAVRATCGLCGNGFRYSAVPVVIEGSHLATLVLSQVLYEPPDMDFFRSRAARYGFDEEAYAAAIASVPVVEPERLESISALIVGMAEALAASGLARLREAALERDRDSNATRRLQLEDLLDSSPVAVAWTDEGQGIEYVNRRFKEVFGYAAEDVPDLDAWARLAYPDEEYREKVAESWNRAMELAGKGGSAVSETESVVACKDGGTRDVSLRTIWVGGRRLLNFTDITERKRAERALKASEEKHRTIFESANDGVFLHRIIERDGKTSFALHDLNQKGCELWGRTREDMLSGRSDPLAVNDPPFSFEEATRRNLLAAAGEPQLFDWQLKRGDGSRIWGQVSLRRIRIGGEAFLLAVMRDISERKQHEAMLARQVDQEKRLTGFVSNMPGYFYTLGLSPDGAAEMRYVSLGVEDVHGVASEEAVKDARSLSASIHPDDAVRTIESMKESARDLETYQNEYRILHPERGERWISARATPYRETDGGTVWHGYVHDITERRRAEDAARESGEKLRSLYELSPLGIALTDIEGRFLEFNEAFRAMSGYTENELLSMDNKALTLPEYQSLTVEQMGVMRRTGLYGPYEKVYRRKDGSLVPIRVNGMLITGKDGRQNIWAFVEDITERKRSEFELEARFSEIVQLNVRLEETARVLEEQAVELDASQEQLKTTEAWYRGILRSAPDGMLVTNGQGRITLANERIVRMSGYSEGELIGRGIEILMPADIADEHSDSRAGFADGLERGSGAAHEGDLRARRKDGSEFPVDVTLSLLPDTDIGAGMVCVAIRDITERKLMDQALNESRARYRQIFDNAQEGMVLYEVKDDRSFRSIEINPAFERLVRIPRGTMLGKTIEEVLPESMARQVNAKYLRCVDAGTVYKEEIELDLPIGIRTYISTMVPVRGEDGTIVRLVVITRDVTERKRLQSELVRREQEFRTLVEHAPDTIIRYDRECRRVYVNPHFLELTGKTAEETLGLKPSDYSPLPEALAYENALRYSFEKGEPCDHEYAWPAAGGRMVTSHLRIVPERGTDGAVASILVIGYDITERRRMEEELRESEARYRDNFNLLQSILESSPEVGIYSLDKKYRFLAFNKTFRVSAKRMWGADVAVGMSMLDAISDEEHRSFSKQGFDQVLAGRIASVESQENRMEDGCPVKEFHFNYASPILDADGEICGLTVIAFNTTERKRMERRLEEALKFTEGVIETIPDILFEMDRNGKYLNIWTRNPEVLETQKTALIGRTAHEVLSPDAANAYMAAIDEADTKGTSYGRVIRIVQPDGRVNWYDHSIAKKSGGTADDDRFIVLSRDVTERVRMEEELRRRERYQRTLLDNFPFVVWLKDADCRLLAANSEYARSAGLASSAEAEGKTDFDLYPLDVAERYVASDRALMAERSPQNFEVWETDDRGMSRCKEIWKSPVIMDGQVIGSVGYARDITKRKNADVILDATRKRLSDVLQTIPDMVWQKDAEGRYQACNPAFEQLIGKRESDIIGLTDFDLFDSNLADTLRQKDREAIETGRPCVNENWVTCSDDGRRALLETRNVPMFGADGAATGVLGVARDISELDGYRRKIFQMAFYDTLTALPNRALFNDRMEQMLADAAWHKQLAGVMLIDMDRFKEINDTLGHPAGDALLAQVAKKFASSVRTYDTVARLGGDEFAVLLPDIRQSDDLGVIARKMLGVFDAPFLLDGKEVYASCSIGITIFPADGQTAEDLMRYADSAMYLAKRSGRNNFRFYSRSLTDSAQERLQLESELRKGVLRGELELFYQPKVELETGALIGSEALLRWRNPERGLVPPDKFIEIAEDCGLIVEIGEWVLREACRTARAWNAEGLPPHRIAVNLSARQFQSNDIVGTVRAAMEESGCLPEWIELEITESLLMDEEGDVLTALESLRRLGISIAIDDFGTGYSSLSYLARFPISTLKIDRSFIERIGGENPQAELVKAIISIARSLRQEVVAEGVETVAQNEFLRTHGCDVAQGYLYGKPIPRSAFELLPRFFGKVGTTC